MPGSPPQRRSLIEGAAALGIALDEGKAAQLCALLEELLRWNRTFNLTAIDEPGEMITHHLLDSLSVHHALAGRQVADVGTGAGFPGLPLALLNPERHFTLLDSNGKKLRFVGHAARLLGLANVDAVHMRAESFTPRVPLDTIVARAFAALPTLLESVAGLCNPQTRVLAMKGRHPEAELAALPPGWQVERVEELRVPGLDEERHLVVLAPRALSHAGPVGGDLR
jgi:16S rRNA (guanine527-N7)-methyltransferase